MQISSKVLIVSGYTINYKNGGSITLANLFKGWPLNDIAIIDADPNLHDPSICINRYRLVNHKIINKKSFRIKKICNYIAGWLGLTNCLTRFKITDEMNDFITNFKPDIIYTQASQLPYMNLVLDINKIAKANIVYHFMDDFPSTAHNEGLFSFLIKKIFDKKLRYLIKISKVRMGISCEMCKAYKQRYKADFFPFHNPLDLVLWNAYRKDSYSIGKSINLTYTGRIGIAASSSLISTSRALLYLREKGYNITLNIYTELPLDNKFINQFVGFNEFIKIYQSPDDINEIANILCKSDILLYPIDFDGNSIKFIRYSMPTKIPTYMASGVPIVVFGPKEVFPVQYAKNDSWALVVDVDDFGLLGDALEKLINDIALRAEIGKRASLLSERDFDGNLIRKSFRLKILETIN